MTEMDKSWARELQRRIAIYDDLEARGGWQGRMAGSDYVGLLLLVVILAAGFWIWGA